MDAIKEKKDLRKKLQDSQKKQFQPCGDCNQLKQKLKACQDETEFTQEMYFSEKSQFNEEYNKSREQLHAMRKENQRLEIELKENQQEKSTIMRKLVSTLVKFEQETNFNRMVTIDRQNQNIYSSRKDYIAVPAKQGSYQGKVMIPVDVQSKDMDSTTSKTKMRNARRGNEPWNSISKKKSKSCNAV